VNGPSHPQTEATRTVETATTGGLDVAGSSIGAWSDEKRGIRHDGIRVDRVAQGGPADRAGVQMGDDILAIDGIYIFTAEEFTDRIHVYQPGTKVSPKIPKAFNLFMTCSF